MTPLTDDVTLPVPDLASQAWVVYVTAVILLLALLSQKIPGILGGIGTAWKNWADNRRSMEEARESAETRSLHEQVNSLLDQNRRLQAQVNTMYGQLNTFQNLAVAHSVWDFRVLTELSKHTSHDIGPPPPLFNVCEVGGSPWTTTTVVTSLDDIPPQ